MHGRVWCRLQNILLSFVESSCEVGVLSDQVLKLWVRNTELVGKAFQRSNLQVSLRCVADARLMREGVGKGISERCDSRHEKFGPEYDERSWVE